MDGRDYGGALVPEEFVVEFTKMEWATNPLNPRRKPEPLTLMQRFRLWRHDLRWSIHDRLFPDCDHGDDY